MKEERITVGTEESTQNEVRTTQQYYQSPSLAATMVAHSVAQTTHATRPLKPCAL